MLQRGERREQARKMSCKWEGKLCKDNASGEGLRACIGLVIWTIGFWIWIFGLGHLDNSDKNKINHKTHK